MSSTDSPTVVVVDGYSAGNFFPPAVTKLGARLVHVQSTPELIPTLGPPNLAPYVENIILDGDEAELVERVRAHAPACVLPGQESAVLLADRLSEALGLATNGTRLSRARRDKYEMVETLRGAGLHCAEQMKGRDPDALVEWAERAGRYPVVVKPVSSAGTDGVYICSGPAEVRAAAEKVFAVRDIFDDPNDEVLIQSYLDGVEYIVDTVSCDGRHHVCGVWRYEKSLLPDGKRIYDKDILVGADEEPAEELIAYVEAVLDALDIRWGPAHTEVIVTAQGPALVEIGARLNGNIDPGFHDACLGANQVDLSVLAYLRPEEFLRDHGTRRYRKLCHGVVYNVPSEHEGVVGSIDEDAVAEIRALPSVHLANVKLKPGSRLRRTTDLLSSPLRVYLAAADHDRLMADYAEVRRLKDSVYRLD